MFPVRCTKFALSDVNCVSVLGSRLCRMNLAQWVIVLLGAPRSSSADELGVLNELIGSLQ